MTPTKIYFLIAVIAIFLLPNASVSASIPGGPILEQDFSSPNVWPHLSASVVAHQSAIRVAVEQGPFGTIDVAGSTAPSGAVRLTVSNANTNSSPWSASLSSGLLAVETKETNLAKLTLSFDNSVSSTRPVLAQIESYNASQHRTGGLEAIVYPAAPDFYLRSALELSDMKPFGAGAFQPLDPFIKISFRIYRLPSDLSESSQVHLSIDNVEYASAAYYVSPTGSDSNDGRTEATAFATPQAALNVAKPGDIILLMNGTYDGGDGSAASFVRPGAPDAWITLKNYPGQQPELTGTGWNIVTIAQGSSGNFSNSPPLAYLEVRGLHIRGLGDVARQRYPEALNQADPHSNTNGIAVDGRYSTGVQHHFRFADNLVEYCPGGGIAEMESDWITIEHNVCRDNCWESIYASSGISILGASNFDGTFNRYRHLVRDNVCYGNQTFYKWKDQNKMSDGNGIIIDLNQHTPDRPNSTFNGRTLVQDNLSYNNGGSGIHTVSADHVDIINNTVYMNSASPALRYSEIFTYGSDDVRILNNIMVARIADVANGERPIPVNMCSGQNGTVTFANNIYYGGNIPPNLGQNDKIADPQFVNPSIDPAVANFHLLPTSPAIHAGQYDDFMPYIDFDGNLRGDVPDIGAFQALPITARQPTLNTTNETAAK